MAMNDPVKESLKRLTRLGVFFPLVLGSILLSGCSQLAQISHYYYLAGRDRDIRNATQDIDAAHDGTERAKAYSRRATAYSDKARYSRAFKLVSTEEYERLFDLAVKDHDQAIALNPNSAEVYFKRGQAYYERASLDLTAKQNSKPWFDHAALDFETATEKDPRNSMAFDMLGLTHEENGEWDKATDDYTRELALNPKLGKMRLADAYCGRGQHDQTQMKLDAAAADYEKSIELGATADDGCSCEPYNSLLVIYITTRQYDKAWEFVHRAQKAKYQISDELVDLLKKESGRTN